MFTVGNGLLGKFFLTHCSICWMPCLAAILITRALDFALGGMAKNGRFVVFISSRSAHFEF